MKKYHKIKLEDAEAQVLLDISQLTGEPVKAVQFPGDIDTAKEDLDILKLGFGEYFWYENQHIVGLYFCVSNVKSLPESIGNLSYLRYLIIESSLVQNIPSSLKELQNLELLEFISGTEESIQIILDFPDVFQNLKRLKTFRVYGNFVIYIPPSFLELKNLEELILEYCYFFSDYTSFKNYIKEAKFNTNELPQDFSRLKSLQTLILRYIYRLELPPSIINQTSLKKLDLTHSQELKNKDIIFNIKSLEQLNLQEFDFYNPWDIPKTIGNLENLKILNIAGNRLDRIPFEISKCQQLEMINLSYCYFKEELSILNSLKNLKTIIYTKSRPEMIPKDLFNKKDLELNGV